MQYETKQLCNSFKIKIRGVTRSLFDQKFRFKRNFRFCQREPALNEAIANINNIMKIVLWRIVLNLILKLTLTTKFINIQMKYKKGGIYFLKIFVDISKKINKVCNQESSKE